jgi:energy-coupling factor transporter ATP-binding protein EcfA2
VNIDSAKERFDLLLQELKAPDGVPLDTEQDARIHLIDRILIEVLGWDRSGIHTETHVESGYTDYLLSVDSRTRIVVEAKRVEKLLLNTRQPNMSWYKVNGAALKEAQEGLEQAKRYCSDTAALFSALTTGIEWIGYWAIRTDGIWPTEGKVAVFPDLDAVEKDFATFYDLFSPEGIRSNLYQIHVHEAEGLKVNRNETLYSVINSTERRLFQKDSLLRDLESVYREFFSTISNDDPDMLARCFVETKESRSADESMEKIASNLLSKIDIVDTREGQELQGEIRSAIELERGEFVLIIGNKGAGKSTFIDRFFRLVLEKSLRDSCLVLRIDLANSDGTQHNIANWLTERLKRELETRLFEGGYPDYDDLQGIFFSEYRRWSDGELKPLYDRDKDAFKEKFGERVGNLISEQPQAYAMKLLENTVRSRKLMPCVIFDNTDHFPQVFQEAVFQYAQSIYRECFSFIICPITDRTVWQLSKSGPLQSYDHRDFYLPVPSTKDVLTKRIEYIKLKAQDDPEKSREYFTKKAIRLSISDVTAFALSVEDVFINEDYIGRMVGMLANFDIRRGLQIAQRIITSPSLDISELVKAYAIGHRFRPKRISIKKALLQGDYNHFFQQDSSFILNLFEVSPDSVTTPLIRLSILRFLMDASGDREESDKMYRSVEDILNYFEPMSIGHLVVRQHLKALLDYRLVEPYDPTEIHIHEQLRIKITPCGRIHSEFATENSEGAYMSEMALMTPVVSREYALAIRDILSSHEKLSGFNWRTIIRHFVTYCIQQDDIHLSLPGNSSYDSQRVLRRTLRSIWIDG